MEETIKKETINVLDVEVYCEHSINEKPPIILIHGFLASTFTYNQIVQSLSRHYSVLLIDLPGFGRSEKSITFNYSFENYTKLILAIMDYFKLEDAFFVGHSMGGQVSLNVAKYAPQRVKKIVLLCSSGYLKKANRFLRYGSYLPLFHWYAYRYFQKKDVRGVMERVLYDHSLITDKMMEEYKRPLMEQDFYKSLLRLLRHREGDLLTEELKQINTPTLLIWGKEDEIVPLKIGEKLNEDLPNSELVVYEKAGHLITDERPKEVYEQIVSFAK
ncbi:alpha/beta fold hydrolase [Alkalibacillus haloalkaliphilus]|uniref:alpha/beta fold hydrolase n=1 Tax=Alkalibacillus haloalkaliphilus TaxID=94136 RepID=UPI0002FF74F3|nr:alpha/beta hydrolase [Alkalibacillus haloalkaliphilus]